jgi:Amt family ammonium transporter
MAITSNAIDIRRRIALPSASGLCASTAIGLPAGAWCNSFHSRDKAAASAGRQGESDASEIGHCRGACRAGLTPRSRRLRRSRRSIAAIPAWVLAASALVLLMTLPGLGLFYGGWCGQEPAVGAAADRCAVASVASLLWIAVGYTLAFGDVSGGWLGSGHKWMLKRARRGARWPDHPRKRLCDVPADFAAITPALMIGAWVDRARFSWVVGSARCGACWFTPRWRTGCGAAAGWPSAAALDFAGGMVVHTTAGISALVIALLLGKRQGFPGAALLPHAPGLTMLGAMLLWVGWFGFNGGSA